VRFYTPFFLIYLASYNPAFSGAWLLEEGEELFIQSLYTYKSDTFVDSEKIKLDTYYKYELNTYMEHGLTDNVTLGAIALYNFVEQEDLKNKGFGNSEFFIRVGLYQYYSNVFSIQANVKMPAIPSEELPKIGTKGWDVEWGLLYGKSFANNDFLDLGIGYRERFSIELRDQIKWHAKYGFVINEGLTIMPALYGTHKVGNPPKTEFTYTVGDALPTTIQVYYFENYYDLIKAEITAFYKIDEKWGVQVGGYKDIYTENTFKGYGGIVGLWRKF